MTNVRTQAELKSKVNKLNSIIQSLNSKVERYNELGHPARMVSHYSEELKKFTEEKKELMRDKKILTDDVQYFQGEYKACGFTLLKLKKETKAILDRCTSKLDAVCSRLEFVNSEIAYCKDTIERYKKAVEANAPIRAKIVEEYNHQIAFEYNPIVSFLNPSATIKTKKKKLSSLELLPSYPVSIITNTGETEDER